MSVNILILLFYICSPKVHLSIKIHLICNSFMNTGYKYFFFFFFFFFLFLAHLSRGLKVSYCDHSPSVVVGVVVVRPSRIFKQPPKPLIGFWPNFTGMILGWSSFKVVQMVPVRCISRSQELKIDFLTKNLKNLLVRNHCTDFNIIWQKCSFGDPLPRLFKPFGFVKKHGHQGAGLIFPICLYRKL